MPARRKPAHIFPVRNILEGLAVHGKEPENGKYLFKILVEVAGTGGVIVNIVSIFDRAVPPSAVEGIAHRLGLDIASAGRAVAVALPAILAMLSGKGSTVAGAGTIFDAAREGSRRHDLAALLGKGEADLLARAIGRFGTLGEKQSADLLDALGPAVLDTLAGEIERQHLDKTHLSRLLCDQRAAIAEALPAGLAGHMSGSRLFDRFRTGFASGTSVPMTVTASGDPARLAQADYARTVRKPPAMRVGIAGVLSLLAIAWLLYATGMQQRASAPEQAEVSQKAPFDHGAYSD